MWFRLEIETSNAAFGDSEGEMVVEVARILRETARRLDSAQEKVTLKLRDLNGNTVGDAEWE